MNRPRLHPEDLDHESRVLGAVDTLLFGNDNYTKLTRKILEAQQRLQELCEPDAWIQYLLLEEAANTRVNFMVAQVAKWAFKEGSRSRQ